VYAILTDAPKSTKVALEGLVAEPATRITLPGSAEALPWVQEGRQLVITLPAAAREAMAVKIQPLPSALVKEPQVVSGEAGGFAVN
jgi:hypothetical protein